MRHHHVRDIKCIVNNDEVFRFLVEFERNRFNYDYCMEFMEFLDEKGTFQFPMLDNGLFPAAILDESTEYTGYSAVWIRDNIFVGYSYYVSGLVDVPLKNLMTLFRYFSEYRYRFENIINKVSNPDNPMERPHVRFFGPSLSEIDQPWEHAQNDALGYFVWFFCRLINEEVLSPTIEHMELLGLFCAYFYSISYWNDKDSGHWEEERKVQASSIGVVVSCLKELRKVLIKNPALVDYCRYRDIIINLQFLDFLIQKGTEALSNILPFECVQSDKARSYDSALLFLCYPLGVVDKAMTKNILDNVSNKLQGETDRPFGVRRYLKDTFWCRDYEDIPANIRTSISSERERWLREHDRQLVEGEEAQWCIFDSIISTIYGLEFQKTNNEADFYRQIGYCYRSLGQLTSMDFHLGGFKCPELYYIKNGQYVPNDATPLLWAQANLKIALATLTNSLKLR
ncbi:MAG: glycoside hydrolase family 15 protein [Candidatus Electrothrix sp. GW3-4]|uniref:glycoside hydrolase family 15 protein n=1 Tax=Candidatus Electrothrix sp. GW3-4 TaxID=3126740 RepID=UPI0030D2CE22